MHHALSAKHPVEGSSRPVGSLARRVVPRPVRCIGDGRPLGLHGHGDSCGCSTERLLEGRAHGNTELVEGVGGSEEESRAAGVRAAAVAGWSPAIGTGRSATLTAITGRAGSGAGSL